jgi:hypothetical protein
MTAAPTNLTDRALHRAIRDTPPASPDHLWDWVSGYTGVRIAREPVCEGHRPPFDAFRSWWFDRPGVSLLLGPRGGGKSFLSAIDTHLSSRFRRDHGTRILGGSKAQSEQIYQGMREGILDGRGPMGSDRSAIASLLKTRATYRSGSTVEILAASPTSVRGPHVPSLKLDEVDEIDPDIRESAMGMCMAKGGSPASVVMTSTWHRVGGPMSALIERAKGGDFPLHSFCLFEVLERCPESRSGPNLEGCDACLLRKWCHADLGTHPSGLPKAKRSDGHYAIDSAIQKVLTTSSRVFEADYLCSGPRADGLWFPSFSNATHVSARAEYDPAPPVYLAIDSGVTTGAVWFQVPEIPVFGSWPAATVQEVRVFAEYLAEGVPASSAAAAILEVGRTRCNGRADRIATDPAGGARNPIGPSVIAEYERAGLKPLRRWPHGPIADGLALLDSFLAPADGTPRLIVHPRCTATIAALANYRRAKKQGQWLDFPEDPQHPHEDLVDALRGGLRDLFPSGRRPASTLRSVSAKHFLH